MGTASEQLRERERGNALAGHGYLRERTLERALKLRLNVSERLPFASRALFGGELAFEPEAELTPEQGVRLARVSAVPWKERAAGLGSGRELSPE